jgi:hypothetical protein
MKHLLPTFNEIADCMRSMDNIEEGKWHKVSVNIKIEDASHYVSEYCIKEVLSSKPHEALNMTAYIKAMSKRRKK